MQQRQYTEKTNCTIQTGKNGISMPAVPVFQYQSHQPVVQGYFTYKKEPFSPDQIEQIYNHIANVNVTVAEEFQQMANSDVNHGAISTWLKSKKIYTPINSMLEEANEDDNISVFSDFEKSDLERWKDLKGPKGSVKDTQFPIFSETRSFLETNKDSLKPEGLLELFDNLSKYNGYDQTTYGFARKMGDRENDEDRQFGSKLSILPLKYLSQTLTGKTDLDWHNEAKSKTNENHFEKGLGQQMEKNGQKLSDFEIMISRARCPHCKKDKQVNRFGKIYADGENDSCQC
ncbi:hypothetical protein MUY27_20485 [Mucilaginibacter sp. RS28]|uniref:Uncharacterized protein n=1 Tax=Mucilaginibacter straminoryzae TaxID=2932774 RepID=A0A9X2BDH8_9SPHI|nr:hypothetical protein [Mucilaginibacter straminoryzae]MCJ8212102.1 hypothetical protein [Mucilaginibacter straminoryzae]